MSEAHKDMLKARNVVDTLSDMISDAIKLRNYKVEYKANTPIIETLSKRIEKLRELRIAMEDLMMDIASD